MITTAQRHRFGRLPHAGRGLGPLLAVLCTSALGCGAPPGLEAPLVLHVQALTGDETLQFVVVEGIDAQGNSVACARITSTCIADQPTLETVPLRIDGAEHPAYRVPLDATAASSDGGQPVEIPGIPRGTNYLLGVELTRPARTGEERVGVGCARLPEIRGGRNPALTDPIHVVQHDDGCNPRL